MNYFNRKLISNFKTTTILLSINRQLSTNRLHLTQNLKKMFIVRYVREKNNVELTFNYNISPTKERAFTLNRRLDEPLNKTFEKLLSNVDKHLNINLKKKSKNEQKDGSKDVVPVLSKVDLYDLNNELISTDTTNADAWKENYKLVLNEKDFKVTVDLPYVRKATLTKLLLAGLPTIADLDEQDNEETKHFLFRWYHANTSSAPQNEWNLICEGPNRRLCMLPNECEGKFLKLVCIPSDSNGREGIPFEVISQNPVQKPVDLSSLPMSKRHKSTTERLTGNDFRIVTYNILANAYADSSGGKNIFFPYCPLEFLDFKYRRALLLHELLNYNADIVFLQECDEDFFIHDLRASFEQTFNYSCHLKCKGEAREGEAILFRNDRFKFISKHDIRITDQILQNPLYEKLWHNVCKYDGQMKELIENRNTILQVVLVEPIDKPGEYILLANTHLFFHPKADFIRLIQSIVVLKYIESVISEITLNEKKNISVIFGGDLNSDPGSFAFNYIFTQQLPVESLDLAHKEIIEELKDMFIHTLNLSTYAQFEYTNYLQIFQGVLDYIFYDSNKYEIKRIIPLPTHEEVIEHVALPSKTIPSDHLALVFDFAWKN